MTTWNEAFVHSLVTDNGSLRDGEKLATSNKWVAVGSDARSAWGQAQGSGQSPYAICVDLNNGASKCSCPSRKFPCKHAVGLMLLVARGQVPTSTEVPDWATKWLDNRERKREAPTAAAKAPDAAAQAKRETARLTKVAAGIEELRLFLEDLIRQGLSDPAIKNYSFWDRIAARMVDAQITPVARRLRALGGLPYQQKSDWITVLADEVSHIYALTEAYQRIDTLPEGLAQDVRAALGFTPKREEVLALGESVTDGWQVLGALRETAEQLQERRTWLYGERSGRYALLLDFAPRHRSFETHFPLGQRFEGEIVYYPSAYPLRALFKAQHTSYTPIPQDKLALPQTIDSFLNTGADALAQNPFLDYMPAGLARAWLTRKDLIDPDGQYLPLYQGAQPQWLNAVLGGDWVPVFGEWDGDRFRVVSLFTTEGWITLGATA
jgi:hypothetical protein